MNCQSRLKVQVVFRGIEGGWGGFFGMLGVLLYLFGYSIISLFTIWFGVIVILRLVDVLYSKIILIE